MSGFSFVEVLRVVGVGDDFRETLREHLQLGARARFVDAEDDWDVFARGSQFWFRVWGLWGPGSLMRLPLFLKVHVRSDDDASFVTMELKSDEGPYLVRLPAVRVAYRRALDKIVEGVRSEFETSR